MNHNFPLLSVRFGVWMISLCMLAATCGEAFAQHRHGASRHIHRPAVTKDAIRHQQAKRAYVAGAIAQHRRERVRDHYEDRIRRDRYYADSHHHAHHGRDDDDTLTNVLIGVAVGAVATGVIMNHRERQSD
jgi:divalent metal cation (Fe/Co/Zn/Cd) transporter